MQQLAFNTLKKAITIASVLISLNTFAPFYIKVDRSDFATKAALS